MKTEKERERTREREKTSPRAQAFRKRMEFNLISCKPCTFPLRLQAVGEVPTAFLWQQLFVPTNSIRCNIRHYLGRLDESFTWIIWSPELGWMRNNVPRVWRWRNVLRDRIPLLFWSVFSQICKRDESEILNLVLCILYKYSSNMPLFTILDFLVYRAFKRNNKDS